MGKLLKINGKLLKIDERLAAFGDKLTGKWSFNNTITAQQLAPYNGWRFIVNYTIDSAEFVEIGISSTSITYYYLANGVKRSKEVYNTATGWISSPVSTIINITSSMNEVTDSSSSSSAASLLYEFLYANATKID